MNDNDFQTHIKVPLKVPKTISKNKIEQVAFFGSADIDQDHPLYQEAFNVARTLAYQGKTIVNGGGPGVMNASTQGAIAGGGKTVAVTFYPKDMPNFEGRYTSNKVDKEIKTANYVERMFGLMDQADAFICFRGGTGTLSEWTTAWLLAHLYYGHHKPLILYGEFWQDVIDVIFDHFFIGETEMKVFKIVKDESEVLEALAEFEYQMQNREE